VLGKHVNNSAVATADTHAERHDQNDLCSTKQIIKSKHSLHRQTLLLVSSHAVLPLFGTVLPHLYALLTVSLVLRLGPRLV